MKRIFSLLLTLVAAISIAARPQKRQVVSDTICHAPVKTMLAVAQKFCYQFQACPDSLFDWAYIGTSETDTAAKKSKESRDVIQLRYKDRVYDPKLKTGDVAIDIYVLGVRWWKDTHLGTKRVLLRPVNARYPLTEHMTATYTGSILEGGDVILRMDSIAPNKTAVHYEFNLVFGRILSSFISDKTWTNAIEWRLQTIFRNLIEYAETGTVKEKKK